MHVAVGIIFNDQQQVLIAERPATVYKPGLWEFPGGKIEIGETIFDALQRELKEEIGIHVVKASPWLQVSYDYGDRKVLLETWNVMEFQGEPYGAEGQKVRWVEVSELSQYQFPEGNRKILEKLLQK